MKFCLDFEATQFSHRIISIGCVAENGATFETLVNPGDVHDGVTKFITKLTGITQEMVAEAPSADEAFNAFFDFVLEQSEDEAPSYFCYGDSDKVFLQKTLAHMSDPRAVTFAEAVKSLLVDYQKEVKSFFVAPNNISLKKVYDLIKSETGIQKHNALEDAQMLQVIVDKMKDTCTPADRAVLEAMPSVHSEGYPPKKKAPEIFTSWTGTAWEADTKGTEDSHAVRCISEEGKVKYFDSTEVAALWLIRYRARGMSPKKQSHIHELEKKVLTAVETGKTCYGLRWEC